MEVNSDQPSLATLLATFYGTAGQPTLTLMTLVLKLFNTTTMSSESAGESVPSWLGNKLIKRLENGITCRGADAVQS